MARKLVFQPETTTIIDIHKFCDGLKCERFTYDNVLSCYSALVGSAWVESSDEGGSISDRFDTDDQDDVKEEEVVVAQEQKGVRKRVSQFNQKWSSAETKLLMSHIKQYGYGSWKAITESAEMQRFGRNYSQVKSRANWLRRCGRI